MKYLYYILFTFIVLEGYSQNGKSPSQPFTSLGQARNVTKDSIYHFNIGGTTFSTFVKVGGYIQVAIDFGNGVGNLPGSTSLTSTARGILNTTVLSKFTGLSDLRVISSTGNIDVSTTNSNMLGRISQNMSLNRGAVDNSYYNTTNPRTWVGTGQDNFISTTTYCNSQYGSSLNGNVFHSCGDGYKFNWMPQGNYQAEVYYNGDIPASKSFQLFARAPFVATLPIELNYFKLTPVNNQVQIDWQTASEKNNDYFTIERSHNGIEFSTIATVKGAGDSKINIDYQYIDENPFDGVSYYRLTQTDFDMRSESFKIQSVYLNKKNLSIQIYPNPSSDFIYIENVNANSSINLVNPLGQNLVSKLSIEAISATKLRIDLSQLPQGLYILQFEGKDYKILKN